MDIQDIMQDLTTDEIISILEHYGSTVRTQNEKEVIFSAVCHSNLDSYKLYYSIEYKTFKCWSRCGNIGDLVDFLVHLNNYTKGDAIKEIKDFFHLSSEPKLRKGFRVKKVYERPKLQDVEVELLPMPEYKPYIYTMFKTIPIPEWECEGITFETIKKFNIRYNYQNDTIVIPHFCHSRDDIVTGIRVRNLNEGNIDKFGKYTPLYYEGNMYNHALSKSLYGLNISKDAIKKYKKVQVYEGEKSCLQSYSIFGENSIAVSICGSSCSMIQKKILIDLGIEEWIWCLDKQYKDLDEELKWMEKISKMSKDLIEMGIKVTTTWDSYDNKDLHYKDAPLDRGRCIFKKLIKNRKEIK